MLGFICFILVLVIGAWFIYKSQEKKLAEKQYDKHQETAKLLKEISEQQKQKNRREG